MNRLINIAASQLSYLSGGDRSLRFGVVERDGCVVFDNDELALRVLQKAISIADERAK